MRIAYCRTNKSDRDDLGQAATLKKFKINKWFIETTSARNQHKPELAKALSSLKQGDVLYVKDLSRLAGTLHSLNEIIEKINCKKAFLVSVDEDINSSKPDGKIKLSMIEHLMSFDKNNATEKQKEGIAAAKSKGLYKGRQPAKIKKELFESCYSKYISKKINKNKFADMIGVTWPTANKLIKAYQDGSIALSNDKYYVK